MEAARALGPRQPADHRAFRDLWFRPDRNALFGNIAFGFLWFSIALMPLFMIVGSVGLVGLFYLWPPWAPTAFSVLWGVTFVSYLFQTLYSFTIDPGGRPGAAGSRASPFPACSRVGVMMLAVLRLKPFIGSAAVAATGRMVVAARSRPC